MAVLRQGVLLNLAVTPGAWEGRGLLGEYSMQLHASRIKVLQAQDDLVNSMNKAASEELLRVSHDHNSYKHLLKNLIIQSLLRLKEPSVLLICRKDDVHLVESFLQQAKEEYAEKANVWAVEIIVDSIYLPSALSQHNAHSIETQAF